MRYVKGDGPLPCDICLIGQRPGKVEVYRGRPFAGPSGDMLSDYLLSASIDRGSCYVTNVVKTFDGVDEVTEAEFEDALPELQLDLAKCQPRYIGLLGRVAVQALLPSISQFDMYWGHGLMFEWQAPWGHVRLMPLYHPAAGLHQTSIQGSTAWDFEQFGLMVRHHWNRVGAACPVRRYKEAEAGRYREGGTMMLDEAAIDTEGTVRQPWCLSWSDTAGKAYVVRRETQQPTTVSLAVMHFAMHDLAVLRQMGVQVQRFEDTLLKASLLGTEPLGLKDLARRHLGYRMREYSELVAEARRERAINYLGEVIEWLNNQPQDWSMNEKAVKAGHVKELPNG